MRRSICSVGLLVFAALTGCGSDAATSSSTTTTTATVAAPAPTSLDITAPVEDGPRRKSFTVPVRGTSAPADQLVVGEEGTPGATVTVKADANGQWTATVDLSRNTNGAAAITATSARSGEQDAISILIPHSAKYMRELRARKARRARAKAKKAAAPVPEPASSSGCGQPDGQEKFSLRFQVRAHDRELKDSPWALVREGGTNYMAAEIDSNGPRLVVLVSFPEEGRYLSGMKAVNGTARTFTDLPEGGATVPAGGEAALACLDG